MCQARGQCENNTPTETDDLGRVHSRDERVFCSIFDTSKRALLHNSLSLGAHAGEREASQCSAIDWSLCRSANLTICVTFLPFRQALLRQPCQSQQHLLTLMRSED